MKTNKFNYLIYLFIVVSLVSLDQYTKSIVLNYFELYQSKTIIDGFFSLTYVQNFGAGFSIMQNARTTFLIITPICLVGFTYLFIKSNDKLSKTALLLMISGTIGNFIDRLKLGYVVDFFYFKLINFPVFNVADIYVTIGTFVLAFLLLFYYKEDDLDGIFHS